MTHEADRLERLLGSLRATIVEIDADYRITYCSRPEALRSVGDDYLQGLSEGAARRARQVFELVFADGIARPFESSQVGRTFVTWVTRVAADAGPTYLCLSTQDATDETNAERTQMAERQKLEVAVQASGIGLWSWHLPTDRVVWDARMREITGVNTPMTFPVWTETLTHPDDRPALRERAEQPRATGQFTSVLSRIVRPDGEIRWVLSAGTLLADAQGDPEWMVGGLMDVTEQQRTAERLQEAHKMESLAHLTGGVAHNFNNMLMIIAPCLEFIRETASGALLEDVDDALKATQRASDIVAQLMTFSGRQNNRDRSVSLASELCEETVRLCRRSFPSNVLLDCEVQTKSLVECMPGSIEQVLGNVLFNARDAVRDVSEPKVRLVARDVDYFGEDWVEITISDNGPGVPPEMRSKIFEPFVTTKGGTGTGLGLASSMAIVQQHGGQLAYRPSKMGGAEFLVLLPRVRVAEFDRIPRAPKSAPRSSHAKLEGVRVLVVDDEPAIRRLLESGLSRYGYEVCVAEGGEEVRRALDENSDFSFVLLDRSLGGEDGTALLPLLRERLPGAQIYFFTGEFIGDQEAKMVEGVVQKPTNLHDLATVISHALSA